MRLYIERFLAALRAQRNFSAHTLRAYAADLAEFEAFWNGQGGGGPQGLNRQSVRSYLARLQGRGLKRASVLRKVSSLRSFTGYLRLEERVLKRDPFLNVRLPKRERTLPRFLTQSEAEALLEKGPVAQSWLQKRDLAILEVLYSCGLRRAELARLNAADVDFLGGVVRVFGKGGRERIVPVGRAALKALKGYLEALPEPPSGSVRPLWLNHRGKRLSEDGIFLIVKRFARKAGLLKPLSPHALRHSFATQLLDGGCDLRSLQEMLGHKTLQATQIYTHTSLERIRKVYDGSHPRSRR